MSTQISQTYIDMIKAFRADCDTLFKKFKNKEKDLKTFKKIWHSLNFNHLYNLKPPKSEYELDFMDDTLQIGKLIMLREDFVGGMFLMYGLYCLADQSYTTIRLELKEFLYILKMLKMKDGDSTGKNKKHLAFVFSKLLKKNAFDFVLYRREYDMEGLFRAQMIFNNKYVFPEEEHFEPVRPKDWLRKFSKEMPNGMKNFENDYLKLKSKIKAVFPYLNLSLDMVQEDITSTILKTLTQADSMVDPEVVDTSIGARRRLLKNRKLKTKHRLQGDDTSEDFAPDEQPPTQVKKKRGPPKGDRKYFFNRAINFPDSVDCDAEEEDLSVLDRKPKPELGLPDLY